MQTEGGSHNPQVSLYVPCLRHTFHGSAESNIDAGNLISKLIGANLQSIMLGHLSKENNFPELAYKTVVDELINNKRDISKLDINVATRIQPSKTIKIS